MAALRVLFSASEIYPFVKTGGLADVAAALPPALAARGIDVRLMLPGYPALLGQLQGAETVRALPSFFGSTNARVVAGTLPGGLKAYALDIPEFYARPNPYIDENGRDWRDNHLRFAAFCRAAADSENRPGWQPDIIHGHDWHCGLIPAYARLRPGTRPATILTVHNIAYQGLFPRGILPEIGLPEDMFSVDGLEYHGQVGYLKAGLRYADGLTAVSPGYAHEIRAGALGCGLEGLLRARADSLTGILNGIDTKIWNPSTDAALAAPYDAGNLKSKAASREALQRELGLRIADDRPLFGVVSRLVGQKGLDLLLEAAPRLLAEGAGLALLGTGDAALEEGYRRLAAAWPERAAALFDYSEETAHRIIGGADAVIIPSRFEPCGLVQMYALRYGTLPVVRRTGGLADTVTEKTGFLFGAPSADALAEILLHACGAFRRPKEWKRMQKEAMKQDFSWEEAAKKYARLYRKYKPRPGAAAPISKGTQKRSEAA
jgi:starch synthase